MRMAITDRPLDKLVRAGDRHRVAAQRDTNPAEPRQLHEIRIVHAGKRERVGAFGGQLLRDGRFAHEAEPFTVM
jgi:hypothetical protein